MLPTFFQVLYGTVHKIIQYLTLGLSCKCLPQYNSLLFSPTLHTCGHSYSRIQVKWCWDSITQVNLVQTRPQRVISKFFSSRRHADARFFQSSRDANRSAPRLEDSPRVAKTMSSETSERQDCGCRDDYIMPSCRQSVSRRTAVSGVTRN